MSKPPKHSVTDGESAERFNSNFFNHSFIWFRYNGSRIVEQTDTADMYAHTFAKSGEYTTTLKRLLLCLEL